MYAYNSSIIMAKAVMAKKLFENLQSDLKLLSGEAKKKHPPVKEVLVITVE